MAREATIMVMVLMLAILGWDIEAHVAEVHAESIHQARRDALKSGFSLAEADLQTYLITTLDANGSGVIINPPTTHTGTVDLCSTGVINSGTNVDPSYCANGDSTATYTATLTVNPLGSATGTAVIAGGGVTRTTSNFNATTDDNGSPIDNKVTYRLNVKYNLNGTAAVAAVNGLLDFHLYPTSPTTYTADLVGTRSDQSASSGASIGFADTLCGDATIGCTLTTSGADTTVTQAQRYCYDPNAARDSSLGSLCAPTGDPSSAPQASNNFQTKNNADQANSTSGLAP